MNIPDNPIGVIDSGVGGLTLVKELQNLLPQENILYFGDNKNIPYGSKTQDEILNLTTNMIDFLVGKNVKLVGVGCNTISTLQEYIKPKYDIEIIGIVDPVVKHLSSLSKDTIGLVGTPFTVKTNYYQETLKNLNSKTEIIGAGCPKLSKLIETGKIGTEELDLEIKEHVDSILKQKSVDEVILGCTHYPILIDIYKKFYPNIEFINPAFYHALEIKDYLNANSLLNPSSKKGSLNIFTTGEVAIYNEILTMLKIEIPDEIVIV